MLINNPAMRALNRDYRGKNQTTDVLSFPVESPRFPGQPRLLGDVVLCVERVGVQARRRNWAFDDELTLCLVHGILHLLGYDHEAGEDNAQRMFEQQAELFKALRPHARYDDHVAF